MRYYYALFVHIIVLLLLQSGVVNVRNCLPLGHGLVELLEGVVHHELRLLPLEVCLHDPVPELLLLVQQLLQVVLLDRAVLAPEYSLYKGKVMLLPSSIQRRTLTLSSWSWRP